MLPTTPLPAWLTSVLLCLQHAGGDLIKDLAIIKGDLVRIESLKKGAGDNAVANLLSSRALFRCVSRSGGGTAAVVAVAAAAADAAQLAALMSAAAVAGADDAAAATVAWPAS